MAASPTSTDRRHARACRREARSSRRTAETRDDRRRAAREARPPDPADVREPHPVRRREAAHIGYPRRLRAEARLRDKVVPRPPSTSDDAAPSTATTPVSAQPTPSPSPPSPSPKSTSVRSTYRYDWAALLLRVFGGARRVPSRSMCSNARAVRARCASSPASRSPTWRGRSLTTSACEPKRSPPCGPSRRPSPSSSFLPPEPHLRRRRLVRRRQRRVRTAGNRRFDAHPSGVQCASAGDRAGRLAGPDAQSGPIRPIRAGVGPHTCTTTTPHRREQTCNAT